MCVVLVATHVSLAHIQIMILRDHGFGIAKRSGKRFSNALREKIHGASICTLCARSGRIQDIIREIYIYIFI